MSEVEVREYWAGFADDRRPVMVEPPELVDVDWVTAFE